MGNDNIDLRKYISAVKRNWYWGVAVFVVVMGLAITYSIIKMPQYESYSMLLIEDNSNGSGQSLSGGMASMMRAFSVGGFGKSSVDNELLIIKSNAAKKALSNRLSLNRTYVESKGLSKEFLYKNSPVLVDAPAQLFDTLQYSFKIKIETKGDKVDLSASKGRFGRTFASKKNVELPCTFETPYGDFQILKTPYYDNNEHRTINVNISGDDVIAANMDEKVLSVGYRNKKADAIELIILDVSKERGRDILNTLMALYNERRRDRKNETAAAEAAFLEERIAQLNAELSKSEEDLATFKRNKDLVDIEAEVSVLYKRDAEADNALLELQVEGMTLNTMLSQLNDPEKRYTLIPMSESLGDANAAAVIGSYNDLVLKRINMQSSAKAGNAALKQLTEQIDAMRESAIENVKRLQSNWQIKYNQVRQESNKYKNRISSLPEHEREYVDLIRDRELKNALYVFLLEKRESALLKQNNTQELGFVFEPAYSAIKPYKAKIYLILGLGFVFALISGIVFAMIVGLKFRKNKA